MHLSVIVCCAQHLLLELCVVEWTEENPLLTNTTVLCNFCLCFIHFGVAFFQGHFSVRRRRRVAKPHTHCSVSFIIFITVPPPPPHAVIVIYKLSIQKKTPVFTIAAMSFRRSKDWFFPPFERSAVFLVRARVCLRECVCVRVKFVGIYIWFYLLHTLLSKKKDNK